MASSAVPAQLCTAGTDLDPPASFACARLLPAPLQLRKMVPAEMKLAHDPTATTPPASPLPMQGENLAAGKILDNMSAALSQTFSPEPVMHCSSGCRTGGNMFVPLSQSSPPDDYTGGSIQVRSAMQFGQHGHGRHTSQHLAASGFTTPMLLAVNLQGPSFLL